MLSHITQGRRKWVGVVVWVTRVARHFTKERASEAKMQCSPKVIATHRVSCDIFITEVKNARSVTLSSLCMCTTFRPAAVIPSDNTLCGRHDGGERKRDVFGGVLVREIKGEIARRGKKEGKGKI